MSSFFRVNKRRKRGIHRKKRSFWQHVGEWVWPSSGLFAFLRWLELTLKRKSGTSHEIALGVAIGAFISFTPLMGLHLAAAGILSLFFGANLLASFIGTFAGNPWTFPFIWIGAYDLGNWILNTESPPKLPKTFNLSEIAANLPQFFNDFFVPMLVGGVPLGIVVSIPLYFVVRRQIMRYRLRRKNLITERRNVLAKLAAIKEASKEKISHLTQGDEDEAQKDEEKHK